MIKTVCQVKFEKNVLSSVFLKFFKNKTIPGQPLTVYGNGFQKLSHASSFESPNISVSCRTSSSIFAVDRPTGM